jgi:excisionase family DNA binding protein
MQIFLSCEDVSARYGVKTSTVWAWVREKKITAVKVGKKYLFKPQDLEKFEAANATGGYATLGKDGI